LVLAIKLSKFFLLLFDLLLNEGFISIKGLHELLVRFLQSGDLSFSNFAGFLQLVIKSRAFFSKHCSFTLHRGSHTSKVGLDILKSLALLIVFNFDSFFLGSDASNLVLGITNELLTLVAKTFLITLNGILELTGKLCNALFLELKLLALKCLISFELDFLLSKFIESLRVLQSYGLNLFIHLILFLTAFVTVLLQLFLLLGNLLCERLFLVF